MTNLAGLLERVRKATGSDRELDAAIWWRLVGSKAETDAALIPQFERNPAAAWDTLMGRAKWANRPSPVPFYSSSIDAALGLVEGVLPGARWAIGRRFDGIVFGTVEHGDFKPPATHGPTPALTLLAALLTALEERR